MLTSLAAQLRPLARLSLRLPLATGRPSVSVGLTSSSVHSAAHPRGGFVLVAGHNGGGFSGSGHGGNGGGSFGGGSSGSGGHSGGNGRGAAARWGRSLLLAAAGSALCSGPALARGEDKKSDKNVFFDVDDLSVDSVTDMLWNLSGPVVTNLGFSGCIGLAAGLAFKKVGQLLAVAIGLLFMLVQGLAYTGAVTVNWAQIQAYVTKTLDANGDGKVDQSDFKHYVNKGLGVMTLGVPSAGGFLAGFMLGVRM